MGKIEEILSKKILIDDGDDYDLYGRYFSVFDIQELGIKRFKFYDINGSGTLMFNSSWNCLDIGGQYNEKFGNEYGYSLKDIDNVHFLIPHNVMIRSFVPGVRDVNEVISLYTRDENIDKIINFDE